MKAALAVLLGAVLAGAAAASGYDDGKDAFGRQDYARAAALLGTFLQASPDDPDAPAAALLRGVALLQAGDPRSGLDVFQKLERAYPQSPLVRKLPYWKGTAALAAGQAALAERELAQQASFPDEEPFVTRARLNLALARLSLGKTEAALADLDAFTRSSKEAALLTQAWSVWAEEDRKAGRTAAALDHARSSWTLVPGGRWALASRQTAIDLLGSVGRWTEAAALIEDSAAAFPAEAEAWDLRRVAALRAIGDTAGLGRTLERLWGRTTDPRQRQDYAVNRARLAEELGGTDPLWWQRAAQGGDPAVAGQAALRAAYLVERRGEALAAAGLLEAWAGSPAGLASPLRDQALSRAAADRRLGGDAAGAARSLDQLLAQAPNAAEVPVWLLQRGQAALELKDSTTALAVLARLLKDHPRAPEAAEARYQTGLAYLQRQEPARAEGWFFGLVQDLRSGDLYERALLARGLSFVNAGQTENARASLQRLVREAPQGAWAGAAWAALGRNALQGRVYDEAVTSFTRALALLSDPAERAGAQRSRAEALVGAGRVDEASRAYLEAGAPDKAGAVWASAGDPEQAIGIWTAALDKAGPALQASLREGLALAQLSLGRPQEGWNQVAAVDALAPAPDLWYRWGQAAGARGLSDWSVRAFQTLLQKYPASEAAQAALPRAAGALLSSGRPDEALARYAEYFRRLGQDPAAAPVARAAAAAALPFPQVLASLVAASRTWALAPEVRTEFSLAWAQARLDTEAAAARAELADLSQTAPWTSQRSEALRLLGLGLAKRGDLKAARAALEAAADLGDDLSRFRARWGLAQVTDQEGDRPGGARQREALEKGAGPGVPREFLRQVLREAAEAWEASGRTQDAARVRQRLDALGS